MSFALPEECLDNIKITEPDMPKNKPMNLFVVSFSFKIHAAIMVMKIGVVSINKEACTVLVSDKPLINKSWFIAMPKSVQIKNLL